MFETYSQSYIADGPYIWLKSDIYSGPAHIITDLDGKIFLLSYIIHSKHER